MAILVLLRKLHVELCLGATGAAITRWGTVALLFLSVSGAYLWWPYRRLSVKWTGPWRRFWLDVHNAVGTLSFTFLFLLSATGIVLAWGGDSSLWFYKIAGSKPPQRPHFLLTPATMGAKPVSPDQALRIARTALPGGSPYEIDMPTSHLPYTVKLRYKAGVLPEVPCIVIVDQYTGHTLYVEEPRTEPAQVNHAIHTGDIFGISSRAIMSLAGFMTAVQMLSGVGMWWKRRRPKDKKTTNRPSNRHP